MPLRFKPFNIYYHSYSGTKAASLKALRTVYDYALTQPLPPLHATGYERKLIDWQDTAVARELTSGAGSDSGNGGAWMVRGDGTRRS